MDDDKTAGFISYFSWCGIMCSMSRVAGTQTIKAGRHLKNHVVAWQQWYITMKRTTLGCLSSLPESS